MIGRALFSENLNIPVASGEGKDSISSSGTFRGSD